MVRDAPSGTWMPALLAGLLFAALTASVFVELFASVSVRLAPLGTSMALFCAGAVMFTPFSVRLAFTSLPITIRSLVAVLEFVFDMVRDVSVRIVRTPAE